MSAAAVSLPASLQPLLGWRQQLPIEALPFDLYPLDSITSTQGCPKGRITEIVGPASSGRTSLLHRLLATAAERGEYAALVDPMDSFDPRTAAGAGADLGTLVWVRCRGNLEHALKAVDLLLHNGGLGLIALDLCDVPTVQLRRIPPATWYRFRRAVENSQAVLLVLSREAQVKSCSALTLETSLPDSTIDFSTARRTNVSAACFTGAPFFRLLTHCTFQLSVRKPVANGGARLIAGPSY
jgi:hypothetical protein